MSLLVQLIILGQAKLISYFSSVSTSTFRYPLQLSLLYSNLTHTHLHVGAWPYYVYMAIILWRDNVLTMSCIVKNHLPLVWPHN